MILFYSSKLQNMFTMLAMLGIVLTSTIMAMDHDIKVLIILYFLLMASTMVGMFYHGESSDYIQFIKILIYIMIFLLAVMSFINKKNIVEQIMKYYEFIALIISVQCIILFFVVLFHLMNGQWVYKEARGREFSFGILGYGQAINYFGNIQILRTCSFFYEPSKLAAFLITPLCWAMAKIRENKIMILYVLIIGFNFLATFSRAGFLALAIGVGGLIAFKSSPRGKECRKVTLNQKIRGFVISIIGLLCVLVIGKILYTYAITESELYSQSSTITNGVSGMIKRSMVVTSSTGNMFVRDDSSFNLIFELLKDNPFGFGLGWSMDGVSFNNPTGLGFWAYSGGFLSIIVLCIIYCFLFGKYYFVCMYSNNSKLRAMGTAFLAVTIQNMSYGTFVESYYLFIIGMMVILVKQYVDEKSGKNGALLLVCDNNLKNIL